MKITNVEAFPLSCPLPTPLVLDYHGGQRTILKRDALLVRVTASNGLVGWAPGVADLSTASAMRSVVAPFLIGRDPADWRSFSFHADRSAEIAYHAAEIALLDLLGRFEGAPLSELIGGRVRDTISLYSSGGMYQPPSGYAAEAAAAAASGFDAYKLRLGGGPSADIAVVAAVRDAVGPDFKIMVDAHTWWRMGDLSYTYDDVVPLAEALGSLGVAWLEEPLPPEDHAAYRELRALGHVPIATGEHEESPAGLVSLASTGAADIVQADMCSHCGVALGDEVFGAVRDAGVQFAFHSWGTLLEVLAAAHLGVCWPATVVPWLEYPLHANDGRVGMYPYQLADDILASPLDIRGDELHVPTGPGLGIDVDPTVIERYPYLDGPWSTFKLHSPPITMAVVGDHSIPMVSS